MFIHWLLTDNLAPNVSTFILFLIMIIASCMEHIAWCNIPCNAMLKSFFLTLRDKLLSVTALLRVPNKLTNSRTEFQKAQLVSKSGWDTKASICFQFVLGAGYTKRCLASFGHCNNQQNCLILFTLRYLTLFVLCFRLADHFGGKLHMGFIKIRDRLKELEVRNYFIEYFMNLLIKVFLQVRWRTVRFSRK